MEALHLSSSHRLQITSYGRFNPVSHSRRSQCLRVTDPRVSMGEVLISIMVESNIVMPITQTTHPPETTEFQFVVD